MLPIYTTDYYQNFVVKGSQGRRDYNDSINDHGRMMDSLPLDHWTYQPDVELRRPNPIPVFHIRARFAENIEYLEDN